MVEAGILGPDDRVELVEGEIVELSPERSRHASGIDLAAEALRLAFGAGHTVRVQHPLALGEQSEPEPDIAVVRGSARDYANAHPVTALLVVEVADSSLDYDRARKAGLYAAAGIPEYWISNLVQGKLEVHRDPDGRRYRDVSVLQAGQTITPVSAPHATVNVADLLP
jgi:Uma2 family endonuclease